MSVWPNLAGTLAVHKITNTIKIIIQLITVDCLRIEHATAFTGPLGRRLPMRFAVLGSPRFCICRVFCETATVGNTALEAPPPSEAVLLRHLEAVKDITLEENIAESRLHDSVRIKAVLH